MDAEELIQQATEKQKEHFETMKSIKGEQYTHMVMHCAVLLAISIGMASRGMLDLAMTINLAVAGIADTFAGEGTDDGMEFVRNCTAMADHMVVRVPR